MSLAIDALDVTYQDVELLVHNTTWEFLRKYRDQCALNFEEVSEEAQFQFVRAYWRYTPDRGSFTNYVRFLIWHELLEWLRRRVSSAIRHPKVDSVEPRQDDEGVPVSAGYDNRECKQIACGVYCKTSGSTFRLMEFVQDLSDDAKAVVDITLRCPLDISYVLPEKPTPAHWRAAIAEFLGDLGWEPSRIQETFIEIGEALR